MTGAHTHNVGATQLLGRGAGLLIAARAPCATHRASERPPGEWVMLVGRCSPATAERADIAPDVCRLSADVHQTSNTRFRGMRDVGPHTATCEIGCYNQFEFREADKLFIPIYVYEQKSVTAMLSHVNL